MNKESKCINWIVHNMNDNFDNICFLELPVLILK